MTMGVSMLLALLTLFIGLSNAGYQHVFNREHFLEVMSAITDPTIAVRSGFLVLYKQDCISQLTLDYLDKDQHFVYMIHDYGRAKEHCWYEYRPEDDLYDKYAKPPQQPRCLHAFFFKKGFSLDKPYATMPGGLDLFLWVWRQVQVFVPVFNHLKEAIIVSGGAVGRPGPPVYSEVIQPGQSRDILTYWSYKLSVVNKDSNIIFVTIVTEGHDSIVIEEEFVTLEEMVIQQAMEAQEYWNTWVWSHGERHLRNQKQALIVHNYTSLGYEKTQINPDLFTVLKRFYNENKPSAHTEELYRANAIIEAEEQEKSPRMINLPEHLLNEIERVLQPILERWCKCRLHKTAIYGIREYYEGNVLRNHVDRIDTHVISAILQIDQDLGGQEDWMLEVIDYEGKRKHVKLYPGEMLLYESAKLIHGRPKPFKGKHFANAFVHFRTDDWDYSFDGRYFHSQKYNINEPLDGMYCALTHEKRLFRNMRDEL